MAITVSNGFGNAATGSNAVGTQIGLAFRKYPAPVMSCSEQQITDYNVIRRCVISVNFDSYVCMVSKAIYGLVIN